MGQKVYIPISKELLETIENFKEKEESVQDFIERLLETFSFQKDIEILQTEKMKELWDNEEDEVWDHLV